MEVSFVMNVVQAFDTFFAYQSSLQSEAVNHLTFITDDEIEIEARGRKQNLKRKG